jgi:DNA-directed RNA polymerase alpha subunit
MTDVTADSPFNWHPLSTRLANVVSASGCRTLREASRRSRRRWLAEANFGRRTLAELSNLLADYGLDFADDAKEWAPWEQAMTGGMPWFDFCH